MISKIPAPFRDHMPEFYLEPLIKLMEREVAGDITAPCAGIDVDGEGTEVTASMFAKQGQLTNRGRSWNRISSWAKS
jgi:hypothetical protein